MSKIGKKSIKLSANTMIFITKNIESCFILQYRGSLGINSAQFSERYSSFFKLIQFDWNNSQVAFKQYNLNFKHSIKQNTNNFWGLFRRLLINMGIGVSQGYLIQLKIIGLGYKNFTLKNFLVLLLGYSHGIQYQSPNTVHIVSIKPTLFSVFGINKAEVTDIASQLKRFRAPEIYKGKGIRFLSEIVICKEGKRNA